MGSTQGHGILQRLLGCPLVIILQDDLSHWACKCFLRFLGGVGLRVGGSKPPHSAQRPGKA